MKNALKSSWLIALLVVGSSTAIAAGFLKLVPQHELTDALAVWHPVNVKGGGVSRVTTTQPDAHGGLGSLEQFLPDHPDAIAELEVMTFDLEPDPVLGLRPASGGFGLLSQLTNLSFDWYRDSASSAAALLTPALRITVFDPDVGYFGATYTFVWEGVYNGFATGPGRAVPVDEWVPTNVTGDNFWRVPLQVNGEWLGRGFCADNPSECFVFDRGLGDWGLSPSTQVVGLSVAIGSGWDGDFHSFVDHVTLDFTYGPHIVWDFEPSEDEDEE